MNTSAQKQKVIGAIALTILWICCFLFISPTLFIDFGANILLNLKLVAILLGLLILIFYHIFYRSDPETTKLSWTAVLTVAWLALIIFYPFLDPANVKYSGAVAFFTLIGGLTVCVLWVRFFADEVA